MMSGGLPKFPNLDRQSSLSHDDMFVRLVAHEAFEKAHDLHRQIGPFLFDLIKGFGRSMPSGFYLGSLLLAERLQA